MATSMGSISSPAPVTLAPKPYPAADGVCANRGRKDQIANIPAPNSSADGLVVHTAGSRMIAQVDQRVGGAGLDQQPQGEQQGGGGEE